VDLREELQVVLEQIKHLQRHIRLCDRTIRTAIHQETKNRAMRDKCRAENELFDLEVDRDRLREEIEGLDFK